MNGIEAEMEDRAVNEAEASRLLGQAVQTLRNHRHLGKGCPYIRHGRSIRYLVSDIRQYNLGHRIVPKGA
jgi:Helix-turn-helix domain